MRRLLLPQALRERVASMPPEAKRALRAALRELREGGPDSEDLDIRLLSGAPGASPVWRLRVGTWRVAFRTRGADIEVLHLFPRSEGYAWMERR